MKKTAAGKVNLSMVLVTVLLLFISGAENAFSYAAPAEPPENPGWIPCLNARLSPAFI